MAPWHEWVVPIRGPTGLGALIVRALSQPRGRGFPRVFVALPYAADRRDGLNLSLRAIMAQAIRAILLAKAMAAILLERRASSATNQG